MTGWRIPARRVLVLEIIEIIFLDDGGGPVSSVKDNPWSEHKHELQPSRHSLIFSPQKRSEQNRTSCPSRNTKSSCFNEFIVYLYICKYHDVIKMLLKHSSQMWVVDGMSVSPGQIFLISQVGIEDG